MKRLILLVVLLLSACTIEYVRPDNPKVKVVIMVPRGYNSRYFFMRTYMPDKATQEKETKDLFHMYRLFEQRKISFKTLSNKYVRYYRDNLFFHDFTKRYAEKLLNRGYSYTDVLASLITLPSMSYYKVESVNGKVTPEGWGTPYYAMYKIGNCYNKSMGALVLVDHYIQLLPELSDRYGNKDKADTLHKKLRSYAMYVPGHVYVGVNYDFPNKSISKKISSFELVYPYKLVRQHVYRPTYEDLFNLSTYRLQICRIY